MNSTAAVEAIEAPAPKIDRRYITAAMMVVMVLSSVEMTVTSTAMPTIIGDLKGLEHYSWVVSIYLLACTVSMPLYGRLADALGRKRVILAAIALFCGASVLAGLSQTMTQLIIFRGLQGLGAGGIMPVVLTILGDIFTLDERARIQGFFSAVWGIASLGGPMLGAMLIAAFGWRSIFFINLPLGLLSFVVLWWKYHDQEKPHSTDLDLPGVVLLSVGCTALLALVSRLGPDGWSWPVGGGLLVVAAGALAGFVRVERAAAHPIFSPALMTNPAIGPSLLGSCLLGIGFLSLDTFVPLYVQAVKGGGATAAAWVVTPVMLTWAISGLFSAPLIVRWGFRKTALLGCLVMSASFVGLVVCAATGAPRWTLTVTLLFSGFGIGPASMAYLLGAQNSVNWQKRGSVTSAVQFARTLGGAIGIGVMGMVFNLIIAPRLAELHGLGIHAADLMSPLRREHLSPEAIQAAGGMIARGLLAVFVAMLAVALGQLAATFFMSPHKAEGPIAPGEAIEPIG